MMFCRNCGNELTAGSRFCERCGQPNEIDETQVSFDVPISQRNPREVLTGSSGKASDLWDTLRPWVFLAASIVYLVYALV